MKPLHWRSRPCSARKQQREQKPSDIAARCTNRPTAFGTQKRNSDDSHTRILRTAPPDEWHSHGTAPPNSSVRAPQWWQRWQLVPLPCASWSEGAPAPENPVSARSRDPLCSPQSPAPGHEQEARNPSRAGRKKSTSSTAAPRATRKLHQERKRKEEKSDFACLT